MKITKTITDKVKTIQVSFDITDDLSEECLHKKH